MSEQQQSENDLRDAELVTVARCPSEVQATIFVSVLADEGIRAIATGGFTSGFRAEAPGDVQVKTLERDSERAREVLAELQRVDADDSDGPNYEPKPKPESA